MSQNIAEYRCKTSPSAPAPAAGVCRLPFIVETLSVTSSVAIYRCKSWNPTCTGSFNYMPHSMHYDSLTERFVYTCKY